MVGRFLDGCCGRAAHSLYSFGWYSVCSNPRPRAQLNSVDPHVYLTDVITKIVNGHPNSRIDELLPWAYLAAPALKHVA